MTRPLIYLAAPYSHASATVRETRFLAINEAAGHLMRLGFYIFSPISHTHPMAKAVELPTDWAFWQGYDELMIAFCGALVVLQLGGWDNSVGVKAEVAIAERLRLPVVYAHPSHLLDAVPVIYRALESAPGAAP